MYAILEIGGKQYKAEKGSALLVDLMEATEGQKLSFSTVTMFRDKDVVVGKPYVENAVVEAKVVDPVVKGDKLVVFKYKSKSRYRRTTGHRQAYTRIQVTGLSLKA